MRRDAGLVSFATAALVLGVALVVYYWLLFDTTVAADPECDRFAVESGLQYGCGRVHNYGLGQRQMLGVIVGVGLTIVGALRLRQKP